MDFFPEELDFLSLFCVEPIKLDQHIPFFYNQSTFSFNNETESFVVKMAPSYSEFDLKVTNRANHTLIAFHSFKTVGKLEILCDKKDCAKILLILDYDRDRFITSVEITFKPKFSIILREHFID